jgi:hypothetical protein
MAMLQLELIRTDGGTQTRATIQQDAVKDYAEAIEAGCRLPPVTVYHDGTTYWLADGFHRYAAHEKLGALEIEADVKQGAKRDAVLHSVGANATHGLRRTNEDKRRAVQVLLEDEEWGQWSNREIARRSGTSEFMVRGLRDSICDKNADKPTERKVKRGDSEYTMQVQPKADLTEYLQPRPQPTYSLPLLRDEPGEATWEIPKLDTLETSEPEILDTMPAEVREAAKKPMPAQTEYTRIQAHMETDAYKRVEFLQKHIPPLARMPEGQLSEDLQLPDSVAIGLPRLMREICREVERDQKLISV